MRMKIKKKTLIASAGLSMLLSVGAHADIATGATV